MADACVVEMPDGSIGVIHVNWNKFTLNPLETDKELITDLEDFFDNEISKQPETLGSRAGYHDDINHPTATADKAQARIDARAKPRITIPVENLPARGIRRNAWRFNPAKDAIVDDQKITTESEVAEAMGWTQEEELNTPSNTAKSRKKQNGRFDLLSPIELDETITDWRGSGEAPPESSFIPPPGRAPIPLVKRGR